MEPVVLHLVDPVRILLELEQTVVCLAEVPKPECAVLSAGSDGVQLIRVVVKVHNEVAMCDILFEGCLQSRFLSQVYLVKAIAHTQADKVLVMRVSFHHCALGHHFLTAQHRPRLEISFHLGTL